jgi:DNA-binding NtrC family response regulator
MVITDILMPDMSGSEMAKEMRIIQPMVKLLFMSGYPDNKLSSLDFPGEQIQFMTKPFTPAELATQVKRCLAGITSNIGEQKE